MANTAKLYLHPNGFYYLDLGVIRSERTGYVFGDTGVVKLKGDDLTNNLAGCEEVYFDIFPMSKLDNAMMFATIGDTTSLSEMEAIMALINEKNEDFNGPQG